MNVDISSVFLLPVADSVAHSAGVCQDVAVAQLGPHDEAAVTMPRRLLLATWLWFATLLAAGVLPNGNGISLAQAPAPAGRAAPATGGGVTTVSKQTYWLEYGLVIVMFGAALYSVCRISRRN